MDIVKQRRKRLMAWILAVVLCVGMWQGSVYATEGEGDGKDTVITEGSDESIEPQSVDPQNTETVLDPNVPVVTNESGDVMPVADGITYNVNINFKNEDGIVLGFGESNFLTNWQESNPGYNNGDNKPISWELGNNGQIYGITGYPKDSLNVSGIYFQGNTLGTSDLFLHNALKWSYSGSEGEKEANGSTISLSDVQKEDTGVFNIYTILGKSLIVTYWEQANSAGTIITENYSETTEQKTWTPESPKENQLYSTEGDFFANWSDDDGKPYVVGVAQEYSEFEKSLILKPNYSNEVINEGTFQLKSKHKYKLGAAGKWVINGYTYESGRDFYVGSDGSSYFFDLQN